MLRRHFLLASLCIFAAPALAADPDTLRDGGASVAVEIVDGDTLKLADGREVRLVGIQAPKLPLGRTNFPTWPLAAAARQALADIALDRRLAVRFGGAAGDRHGRVLAHLFVDGAASSWVQGAMLRRGMARVYTFPDNRALAAELYAAEREARAGRRGIWADPFYRVRDAVRDLADLARGVDTFQLVEGWVLSAGAAGGRAYLNFGQNWREDFTVSIADRHRAAFRDAGLAPDGLAGRQVRVRGWLKQVNGPMIEATHPEQIEVLP
jgi:endonuclease YncB( thermonuclease family)